MPKTLPTAASGRSDDFIDSRDVIARIEELEEERGGIFDNISLAESGGPDAAVAEWDEENAAELAALKALAEEAEGYADNWEYGATLVRDSYFEEYARELAKDIHGLAIRDAAWPFDCISWEAAAEALQQDYTSVDFDGVTYWVR